MPRYESPYDPASMPKDLEHVRYEKKGHVAYVTINRPEVRNALHSLRLRGAPGLLARHGARPRLYVGIVTGEGEAFCAGRDVKFLAKHQAEGKRTPHEDPTNPMYPLGRRRAAERREPGEAADRRPQRVRRGRRAQPRAPVPAPASWRRTPGSATRTRRSAAWARRITSTSPFRARPPRTSRSATDG